MDEDAPALTLLGSGGWMSTHRRNTAAVQLHSSVPLMLDGGTGLGALAGKPAKDELHVVLTHFHLDHIVGLSYLPALDTDTRISVYAPGQLLLRESSESILETMIGSPYLSVPLKRFVAEVKELREGSNDVGGVEVLARKQELHAGGSVALRVGDVTYCTDTEPDKGNISFASGSKFLLHEAWQPVTSGNGHSSAAAAASIARAAEVETLVLCHLHPLGNDEATRSSAAASLPNVVLGHDDLSL